jgi:hypothetical protein
VLAAELQEALNSCLESVGGDQATRLDLLFDVAFIGEPDVGAVVESVTLGDLPPNLTPQERGPGRLRRRSKNRNVCLSLAPLRRPLP